MGVIGGSREFVGQGLMEEIDGEEYTGQFFGEEYTVEFEHLLFLVFLVFSLYLENASINCICAVRELVK